jgi:hypothetical protein
MRPSRALRARHGTRRISHRTCVNSGVREKPLQIRRPPRVAQKRALRTVTATGDYAIELRTRFHALSGHDH